MNHKHSNVGCPTRGVLKFRRVGGCLPKSYMGTLYMVAPLINTPINSIETFFIYRDSPMNPSS